MSDRWNTVTADTRRQMGMSTMVTTMTLDELLSAAASIGLQVSEIDDQDAPLYVWTTPQREILYIGKAASPRRFREEAAWSQQDPTETLLSAFVALIRRNKGEAHALRLDGYDASVGREAAQGWSGGAFNTLATWLDDPRPISVDSAETLLIRIAVRCGVPIGNSKDASQWDRPLGNATDTLAALAALPYLHTDDVFAADDTEEDL